MPRAVLARYAIVLVAGAAASAGCRIAAGSGQGGRPSVAVDVAPVERGDFVETVDVVGSLSAQRSATLKSEYSGIVAAVYVTEWVPVRKGEPLAALDTREDQASLAAAVAAELQAEVAEARAVREMERAEKLMDVGLMTRQGLEDARTARDASSAGTAAARARVAAARTRLAKAVIRAPFDGVVVGRGVNVGDRVESMGGGDPMFEVIDPRVLELTMTVPSSRLSAVQVGQVMEFGVDAIPDRRFSGRIEHVNSSVDPQSRAGKVLARVRNDDGLLRSGLFAKGRIRVGVRAGVLRVPQGALQGWDLAAGTGSVFVIHDGTAERRAVRTGASDGDWVEVASGVAAGERVATRGAFGLRGGDRVKTAPGA